MDKDRKLGRELEDISHFFLSSSQPDQSNEIAQDITYQFSSTPETPLVLGIFCCLPIKPFFSCNLSLEIAKRNRTISVIDLSSTQPSVRYLMGNLIDLQGEFPEKNGHDLDFIIETIELYGFSKINILSLRIPWEQLGSKNIMEKILGDKRIRESKIILINSLDRAENITLPEPFSHFQKTLFIMDSHIRSLLDTYLWIKKLSPCCQQYLIGTVIREGGDTSLSRQHIEKLQKTVHKYLAGDINIIAMNDITIDHEAVNSIKLRRPLALMESSSASGKAMAKLSQNLLELK